jgi:hypothetical protein
VLLRILVYRGGGVHCDVKAVSRGAPVRIHVFDLPLQTWRWMGDTNTAVMAVVDEALALSR